MGKNQSCCQNNEDLTLQAVRTKATTKLPVLEDNFSKASPNKHSNDHKLSKSTFNLTTGKTAGDAQDLLDLVLHEQSLPHVEQKSVKPELKALQEIDNDFSVADEFGVHDPSLKERSLLLADLSVIPNH